MVDLYSVTVDDYSRAALQSTGYYLFLKGGRSGTGPSASVLKLKLASRSGNLSRVAKLVDELLDDAGLNTRVPHLEGERVFGYAKRKLDLPPGDDGDSHRHDRVNFSVPKLSKRASPDQCHAALKSSDVSSTQDFVTSIVSSASRPLLVRTKNGHSIVEFPCTNLMDWRIEPISPSSLELCRDHSANGSNCNAKIVKYRRAVAPPTFTGIQRRGKSRDTQQMQFWFCPGKLQACVKETRSRSILHYPTLPLVWPVKLGTSLSQAEVDGFEASGFVLASAMTNALCAEVAMSPQQSLPLPSHGPSSCVGDVRFGYSNSVSLQVLSDGNRLLKHRSGKLFRFVAVPSTDHILKIESSRSIDCTILKSLKVPERGLEVIFSVFTSRSITKECYEVTISTFPACTCKGFQYMCTYALGNPSKKWILCKHLYFILQTQMLCTLEDAFIYCLGWTLNEVRQLIGRIITK